jgi:hypothetical protein
MIDPDPSWPEHRREQRLGMPRRHVDDQISNSTFRDRLKVFADRAHVRPVDERDVGFQHRPGLDHEFIQLAAGHLRLQEDPVDRWRVQGWR